jgi:hypothetical protein
LVINIFLYSWNVAQVTIHLFYLSQRPLLHVRIFKTAEHFHNLNNSERDTPDIQIPEAYQLSAGILSRLSCDIQNILYAPYLADPWVEYRLLCIQLRCLLLS